MAECIEPDKKKKRRIIKPSIDLVCHIASYCLQIALSAVHTTVTAQLQIKNKINLISKRVEFIDKPTLDEGNEQAAHTANLRVIIIF